jgi:Tfp pilus assembly protein PilF
MTEPEKNYFQKNMGLLKKNHPELLKTISRDKPSDTTQLAFGRNQKPNLKVKTDENEYIWIHDPIDPGIESETFLSMVKEDSTGVVLMLGMGLGYSVLELLKKRKKIQHLIVFELNIDFFVQALQHMNLAELLTDRRVMICLGEQADLPFFMAPANRALMLEDIHTLNLQSCFRANSAYEQLSSQVFDYINAFNTEGATKTAHGRTFFENRLKHLTSMHHDKKLEDLADQFKGIPALIIAAGPSLDKNIDQIKNAAGKAILISVDTALPSLLKQGITPNFLTSIDYQELTYEKIAGSASNPAVREISLICTSWVTDAVAKRFPAKNIFWAFNDNPLENWINISLGGKLAIPGAGTVAHLNFIAAQIMGCDPVIFVGQDLAFSNSKGHSSNVVLSNDENAKKMLDKGQDIMWVAGIVESKVPTNRQMFGYKHMFEKLIKASKGTIINSTEGGVLIEGVENMPLEKAIDRFCKDRLNFDIKYAVNGETDPAKAMESVVEQIKKLEKIIQKAEKLSAPIKKDLAGLKKNPRRFSSFSDLPEKLKKKISDLDTCHKKADGNTLWPLFDEMTMEGLRQNERQKQEIEILKDIPGKYLEWLAKSVERIDKVNKIRIANLERFKNQINDLAFYYTNEKSYLKRIKKNGANPDTVLKPAELYYQSENYVLLEKMLNKYASDIPESADMYYYYGIIALIHEDYDHAENRFQSALNCDDSYAEKIHAKRKEFADNYLKLAKALGGSSALNPIAELLLLKGLKCCPDHTAIISEFRQFGKNLLDAKNYQAALAHFHQELSIIPDNPDTYITLADIYFALEDFDSGLKYLKTAVDLDKKYAVYWHNMGKNLQAQKDYNGAILAYEQYFIALPENISVLKEMGDCYTELGNLEAAREAYQQFKKRHNK